MNTQSTNLFSQISTTDNQLTAQVQETMAMDASHVNTRILSSADVWNIQRNKRARVQRRFAL